MRRGNSSRRSRSSRITARSSKATIAAGCFSHIRIGLTRQSATSRKSATIADVESTPGRLLQSIEMASYDAWIRYYRPDENSPNVSISYYAKGQLLGFLLDARIRRLTNGARSLDDVMRLAYARYSGARGFTPDQFREVAEQIAGTSLADFWNPWVKGTAALAYSDALTMFGLRFGGSSSSGRASLGVTTRNDSGRHRRTRSVRSRAASACSARRVKPVESSSESGLSGPVIVNVILISPSF